MLDYFKRIVFSCDHVYFNIFLTTDRKLKETFNTVIKNPVKIFVLETRFIKAMKNGLLTTMFNVKGTRLIRINLHN